MPRYNPLIYATEIWNKTDCLQKEELTNQTIFNLLEQQGYQKTDHFRIFQKDNQTVIVSLVDDFRSCSTDYHVDLPYLFDRNTTVITDNRLTCPTIFQVQNLPESFFGIYSYTPNIHSWKPERDFAFQVNRVDARRFKLMSDLAWRTRLDSGYINFNCEDHDHPDLSAEQTFVNYWSAFGPDDHKYRVAATRIANQMPFKNYNIDFDLVPCRVWMNLVVETYSSDATITLSEKIFRALVTPAPWTVYSGRYTVAYLESLGFDCMSDIIDHNHYDRLKEVENKLGIFNWKSLEIVKHLKELGEDQVRDRCLQASLTNQHRLAEFQRNRQQDFDRWLSNIKI
jgi:ribosomal protein S15P/S13E